MRVICPLCGRDLASGPSYGKGTSRFTPAICDNTDCRVLSVTIEWITGPARTTGPANGADQETITAATRRGRQAAP